MSERIYTPRIMALFGAGIAYFTVAGISFPVLPRLVEDELGGSRTDIGLAFGVFALGMLLVRPIAGVASDRIGRRPLMIFGALGVGLFQLLHVPAAETGELWVLLLVRVGTGGFSSIAVSRAGDRGHRAPTETTSGKGLCDVLDGGVRRVRPRPDRGRDRPAVAGVQRHVRGRCGIRVSLRHGGSCRARDQTR